MAKKRGKFRFNGVGTKTEQHAERALQLAKLKSPNADPLVYLFATNSTRLKNRSPRHMKKWS